MKAKETITEALELKVDTDKDILPNPEGTGQRQYQDLVILLAELEAEGYFAEPDVATQDRDELPSDPEEETVGQEKYEAFVTLLAELEAEGYFAEPDAATQDRDELPSDPEEETVGQEKYEAFVTFLAELEAEGCLSELNAATLGKHRAQSWLKHQGAKLIQLIAAMRTKPIACFDRHTTLTAKVA